MLAGITFIDKSEAARAVEEDRKALKKQKRKEKKVCTAACCSTCSCTLDSRHETAFVLSACKTSTVCPSGDDIQLQSCLVMLSHAQCRNYRACSLHTTDHSIAKS